MMCLAQHKLVILTFSSFWDQHVCFQEPYKFIRVVFIKVTLCNAPWMYTFLLELLYALLALGNRFFLRKKVLNYFQWTSVVYFHALFRQIQALMNWNSKKFIIDSNSSNIDLFITRDFLLLLDRSNTLFLGEHSDVEWFGEVELGLLFLVKTFVFTLIIFLICNDLSVMA